MNRSAVVLGRRWRAKSAVVRAAEELVHRAEIEQGGKSCA
jgi:hypothetical protein